MSTGKVEPRARYRDGRTDVEAFIDLRSRQPTHHTLTTVEDRLRAFKDEESRAAEKAESDAKKELDTVASQMAAHEKTMAELAKHLEHTPGCGRSALRRAAPPPSGSAETGSVAHRACR